MVIRGDRTIVEFEQWMSKTGREIITWHGQQKFRCHLRELDRFLIAIWANDNECQQLSDWLKSKFNSVCATVKQLDVFDESTTWYKIPSLAIRLGQKLRGCADIVRLKAICETVNNLRNQFANFRNLSKGELEIWNIIWSKANTK